MVFFKLPSKMKSDKMTLSLVNPAQIVTISFLEREGQARATMVDGSKVILTKEQYFSLMADAI